MTSQLLPIYKRVEMALDKKPNQIKLKEIINKYISRNNSVLLDNYPTEHLAFTDDDRKIIYEILDVKEEELKLLIKNIKFINSAWKTLTNPFNFALVLIIRYFEIKKEKDMTMLSVLYLSFQMYGMLHVRYLRFVQKETMVFTVSHLSNKHDLKEYKTILKTIYKKAEVCHETYKKDLIGTDDKKIINYIISLNNRIKQWIIGIMLEYKRNKDSGNFFNITADELHDEENYRENSNTSMDIDKIANRVSGEVSKDPVNYKIVEMSSKICLVPTASLYQTITDVKKKNDPSDINEFIKLIVELYISDAHRHIENIASNDYTNYILRLYNQSNTADERLIKIKEILDKWLSENSEAYLKTNRVATKINWRKAVFIYFALIIQYYYVK